MIRDRKKEEEVHLKRSSINEEGVLPLTPAAPPRLRTAEMPTTAVDGPPPYPKHVPGYTGFVAGVQAENIGDRSWVVTAFNRDGPPDFETATRTSDSGNPLTRGTWIIRGNLEP